MKRFFRSNMLAALLFITASGLLAGCAETDGTITDTTVEQPGGKGDVSTAEQSLVAETDICREAHSDLIGQATDIQERAEGFQGLVNCIVDAREPYIDLYFSVNAEDFRRQLGAMRTTTDEMCALNASSLEPDSGLAEAQRLACLADVEEQINYLVEGVDDYTSMLFSTSCPSAIDADATVEEVRDAYREQEDCAERLAHENLDEIAFRLAEREQSDTEVMRKSTDELLLFGQMAADGLAEALMIETDFEGEDEDAIFLQRRARTLDLLVAATTDPYSFEP